MGFITRVAGLTAALAASGAIAGAQSRVPSGAQGSATVGSAVGPAFAAGAVAINPDSVGIPRRVARTRGTSGVVASTVPEPSTYGLLAMGLGGLAVAVRVRLRQAA